jgi:hypothetical protein
MIFKTIVSVIILASLGFTCDAALARGGGGGHGGGGHSCGGHSSGGFGGGGAGRGGGGWGNQDYRDPHLWNGDAYVNEQDKAAWGNYRPNVGAQGGYGGGAGNYGAYYNGGAMHNSVPGQVYGGPAFIGPDNYDTVVQNYSWPKK